MATNVTNNKTENTLDEVADHKTIEGESRAIVQGEEQRAVLTKAQAVTALLRRVDAQKPSDKDRQELRKVLEEYPEIWIIAGDMARLASDHMIETIQAGVSIKESLRAGLKAMQADLGYKDAPQVEKLLIEQVVICWLDMYQTQYRYAHMMSQSLSLSQGAYWDRRLTMVQGRYLKALETLARVRKLSKAAPLQVNIGGQQINVAANPGENR